MTKRWIIIAVAVLLLAVGGWAAWRSMRTRTITLDVFTDYSFRFAHANWSDLIQNRVNEVNRIYSNAGTKVTWRILTADSTDPSANAGGIDNRRAMLVVRPESKADILVVLTGIHEGNRTDSAGPFSRVAVVIDFPDQSEAQNSALLANVLARLFGAPADPNAAQSGKLSDRAAAVVRSLRDYDFPAGIDGLTKGSMSQRAASAIAKADTNAGVNAESHAHEVLGTAFLNERRRELAAEQFKKAVELAPKDPQVRVDLALAYSRMGQDEDAVINLREAIKLSPDKALFHQSLGAQLIKMKQSDDAIDELKTAVRLDPKNPVNFIMLGTAWSMHVGGTEEATAAFQEALKLDPNLTLASRDLEQVAVAKERMQEAIAKEREAVQKSPNDSDAHYRLGAALGRADNLNDALKEIQKSLELRPNYGPAHSQLAILYYQKADYKQAWAEVKKARDAGTNLPPAFLASLTHQMSEPK